MIPKSDQQLIFRIKLCTAPSGHSDKVGLPSGNSKVCHGQSPLAGIDRRPKWWRCEITRDHPPKQPRLRTWNSSGGFNRPLWKMMEFVSWDDYSQYMEKMFQATSQSWNTHILKHQFARTRQHRVPPPKTPEPLVPPCLKSAAICGRVTGRTLPCLHH